MSKRTRKATPKKAEIDVLREKVAMYEGLLHDIQMYAEVVLRGEKVRDLVYNICSWSYSHRVGNGENSEERQDEIIRCAFLRLRDVKPDEVDRMRSQRMASSGLSGFSGQNLSSGREHN